MTIRHFAGAVLRRLFPRQMELRKIRMEYVNDLNRLKMESERSREEWVEKIKEDYKQAMGCDLNLENPVKLTEKIQYRKLYEDNLLYSKLSDKYAVREWIKEKIGEEYLIPLLGVWDRAEDIQFKSLPDQFVLKTNNGSGMNIIVKDKKHIDKKKTVEQLKYWLNVPFWSLYGEFHYKDIKPKIIAERYISQMDGNLMDYKIYCFNGTPEFILLIGDRDAKEHTGREAVYDFDWNRLPWTFEDYPAYAHEVEKPALLDELYRISKRLCEDFSFVRVDLYIIDDHIKFGEMTFTPGRGIFPYRGTWTEEVDLKYGRMMKLN